MDGFAHYWSGSDAIGRAVTLLLLAMSVSAWVVIFWKSWVLQRAARDIERAIAAFWSAPSLDAAREQLPRLDREQVVLPLVLAALTAPASGTLETHGHRESQLTRRLRDALHRGLHHLRFGQVLLASIGSTAPFVGLFGTVWGIYHALLGIASSGGFTIERVAGPVGEALIMTAAGLAVAIPAVLAYNIFGQWVSRNEAELEGFAHDLRELMTEPAAPSASHAAQHAPAGAAASAGAAAPAG
jgi:biopolymer transport protein ExbB